jgi:mRNA-degrading endonuclease RelE of RelBE toxin-antitoxin system
MYALYLDKRVEKDLANLPKTIQVRVMKRLENLQENPFAGSLKLRGEPSYRARRRLPHRLRC